MLDHKDGTTRETRVCIMDSEPALPHEDYEVALPRQGICKHLDLAAVRTNAWRSRSLIDSNLLQWAQLP